jgi:hypothetical protein
MDNHMAGRKFLLLLFILPALGAIALGAEAVYLITHPAVVVEWSTASELDTVGFNLYRSEDPKGNFTIVNDKLIPSSSDALVGGNYSYRDTTVQAGHTYYYILEDVNANGATSRNGPIQVKAETGGILEIVVAGLMSLVAAVSLYLLLHDYRVKKPDVLLSK